MTIPTRQADLAYVLADCGVVVTLGAASTHGTVRSADGEVLRADGSPVAVRPRAILVTIQTGTLAGLHEAAQITVAGAAYVVDGLQRVGDGESVRLLASPVVGALVAGAAAGFNHQGTRDEDTGVPYLAWTVPGESAQWGVPAEYDVRVSLVPITSANAWTAATSLTGGWTANPLLGGSAAGCDYDDGTPGATYWFGVRYRDALGNVGALSNSPSVTLDEAP
jgi:hypothetical protein